MKTTVDPFEKYKEEYWKANKKRKGEILNVLVELTALHKKSIIRKFKKLQFADPAFQRCMPVKRGKPCVYNFEIISALKQLWELSSKLCGELLHPMIGEYLEQYKNNGDWKYGEEVDDKLLIMSVSTVKKKVSQFFKKDRSVFRKGKQQNHHPSKRLFLLETLLGLMLKSARDN